MPDSKNYLVRLFEDPERGIAHLLATLQATPVIGGAFSALSGNLSEFANNKRFEHVETMMRAMNDRIAEVAATVSPGRVQSTEYAYLVIHGIDRSQFEYREFKLKMLGRLLAEMATDSWSFTFDVGQSLFDMVADMSELQVELLHLMYSRGIVDLYEGGASGMTFAEYSAAARSLGDAAEDRQTHLVKGAVAWLVGQGLATKFDPQSDGGLLGGKLDGDPNAFRNVRYSITALGVDLHQMVTDQRAPYEGETKTS